MKHRYMLACYWKARKQSLEDCEERLSKLLGKLADCDTSLACWYPRGRSKMEASQKPVNRDRKNELIDLLQQGRNRRDVGKTVIEELGFHIGLWNGAKGNKVSSLDITCGLYAQPMAQKAALSNSVIINLPEDLGKLANGRRMVAVLTAVIETWEPDWGGVMSKEAMKARNFSPSTPFVDWIVFVPSSVTVAPPPSSLIKLKGYGTILVTDSAPPVMSDADSAAQVRRICELLGLQH